MTQESDGRRESEPGIPSSRKEFFQQEYRESSREREHEHTKGDIVNELVESGRPWLRLRGSFFAENSHSSQLQKRYSGQRQGATSYVQPSVSGKYR